jgi:hypothetical protein
MAHGEVCLPMIAHGFGFLCLLIDSDLIKKQYSKHLELHNSVLLKSFSSEGC